MYQYLFDNEKPEIHNFTDLRPMRGGDCFKFRYASANSATGHGSWILFGDDDQVYAFLKNSSTKISGSAPIPLPDRCPELAMADCMGGICVTSKRNRHCHRSQPYRLDAPGRIKTKACFISPTSTLAYRSVICDHIL